MTKRIFKLTGTYEYPVNKFSVSNSDLYIYHHIELPLTIVITISEDKVNFKISDYDFLYEGDDPEKRKVSYSGKVENPEVDIVNYKDNSGKDWIKLDFQGSYNAHSQKFDQLILSKTLYGAANFLSVSASWPHKVYDYSRAPIEHTTKSILMDLNEKGLKKFDEMILFLNIKAE